MTKLHTDRPRTDTLVRDWPTIIGLVITIISLTVGSVVWAFSLRDDLKTWTGEQVHVIKQDINDQYTKKDDFARIEQKLENQEKNIEKMDRKIDQILDKLMKK